ncbi:MAG: hypothetical protein GY856_19610 [bacterium]|nr:hypothetical protein [bacterium]
MKFARHLAPLAVHGLLVFAWALGAGALVAQPGDSATRADRILFGVQIGGVGILAVFFGLLVVYTLMTVLRTLLQRRAARAQAARAREESRQEVHPVVTAEAAHAIALALHMDLRVFDDDSPEEITIEKITQPFSPWTDAAKTRVLLDNQKVFRKAGR